MKSVKITFAMLFLSYCQLGYTQNLIPNFSFEENEGCPSSIQYKRTKWLLTDWVSATDGTPDYYHRCSTNQVSIPYNWAGKAQPVHGEAYAGLYLWGGYREFLKIKLEDTLRAGVKYHLVGYFQIASYSHYVVGDFGVSFQGKDLKLRQGGDISVSKEDPFDGNPLEWEKIHGSFIAKGGETHMVLGNFNYHQEINAKALDINAEKEFQLKNRSYAYVDYFRLWEDGSMEPVDSSFITKTPDVFTLSDINFELDSYQLKEIAKSTLEPLVNYVDKLGENDYVLLITGYTDDLGESKYNQRLSRNRAKSVAVHLLHQGISKNLLKIFGKGELDPIYPNDSEEHRQKNRRVEILVKEL